MATAYCGKDCTECVKKETNGCTGCASGAYVRDCDIAKCCREKGHENCVNCTYVLSCRTSIDRDLMPEKLIDKQRRYEELYQKRMANAKILGKWLWTIFWCMIASEALSLLDLDFITNQFPIVGHISSVITWILAAYIGWSYLQMAGVDDRFRFVGLVQISVIIYGIARDFLPKENWIYIILSITAAIFNIMSAYRKCMAYSDSLSGISDEMSEKWQKQWNLYKYSMIGFPVCIVLLFIPLVNFLAVIALLVVAVIFIFVTIREYVYIYQTADLFRACP